MQRNTGYFPTESLEPSGNRLFSRSALNEGDLFRGSIVYGIANGIPDFLDIREKTKELHDEGFTGFIQFLSIIGNGDEIFCFDKDNNIVLLDCYTTGEAAPVEGAFSDCLMKQIAELEERKNKKIRGEDKNN